MGAMKKQTEPGIVIEWNGRDGATTLDAQDTSDVRLSVTKVSSAE